MLKVTDLGVSYGRAQAVRGLSFEVGAGESVAIVGPNGAGKSSTMLAIAGALRFRGGIEFEGRSLAGLVPEQVCRLGLSLVPEGRGIFPALTVEENLLLGTMLRRDRAALLRDRDEIYERFLILGERRHMSAGKLSGGEQQQLAIARALMTRPRLLLIDEPSLGLAPMMVNNVYAYLTELRAQGMTMLIVEQSLTRALSFFDRLLILREGQLRAGGRIADLQHSRAVLEDAYFGFSSHAHTPGVVQP
ncbi:ABC transporter ATP-binding protein [Propylenella binzhouense]|uniref:ABC transporter ATP-binding protein n=1 Tax=Propylenella binzhouense TaxID=2555902 RepID=A0A964T0N3_9HYPH|nr:ABC transporter ATP-binding protein [Propylenella binzhouense]MYZ46238.1 ABC transporter ATP-binding protein [Propylenella binzhouense]